MNIREEAKIKEEKEKYNYKRIKEEKRREDQIT